ncbi:MAG: SsrA-binding protein SmpB [Nitrospinae bacterium]|nr:SsrA-binding protein SmpB [Nitrospinota bacterium]
MSNKKIVCENRKARHDYYIEETYEVGIALKGTEVKSLRQGKANLKDSYAGIESGEVYLYNCHISAYTHGNILNHDPLRKRKLLLHKSEIKRLYSKTEARGFTLIPLRIYFTIKGIAKLELAVAKGKKVYDKRETLKRKTAEREMERALKERSR